MVTQLMTISLYQDRLYKVYISVKLDVYKVNLTFDLLWSNGSRHRTEYRIRSTEFEIQNTEYRIQ